MSRFLLLVVGDKTSSKQDFTNQKSKFKKRYEFSAVLVSLKAQLILQGRKHPMSNKSDCMLLFLVQIRLYALIFVSYSS